MNVQQEAQHPIPGPSSSSSSSAHSSQTPRPSQPPQPLPTLFLPPQLPQQERQKRYLTSTQDLLGRFNLLSRYDKYVRPHIVPLDPTVTTAHDNNPSTPTTDKGKGKEKEKERERDRDKDQDEDDEDGGTTKKKKDTYKHLIKGVPGKHSMRKDDYLMTMMQVPPKQRIAISPFDQRTQREAFSVSLEGLKGWNVNSLVLESAQAREDRKKRKELKKQAKAHSSGSVIPQSSHTSPFLQNSALPTITSHTTAHSVPTPGSHPTPRTATPKPRPQVQVHVPGVSGSNGGSRAGTPTSAVSQHSIAGFGGEKRGKKRDFEEAIVTATGASARQGTGVSLGGGQNGLISKGAGTGTGAGVPRALKKQRMDMAGQARDMSTPTPIQHQQPTPQGV